MNKQEHAAWMEFYIQEGLEQDYSAREAQRFAEQHVRELEEYGMCCDECGKVLDTLPMPSRDPFPVLCWSCFKKENGLDREEDEYSLYEGGG